MSFDYEALRARLLPEPPALVADALKHAGDHALNPSIIADYSALRPAAVLVGLVARAEPMVLLTTRAGHLNAHAGQVAFPGGKIDGADGSPLAAALREAEEEIGLEPRHVQPLGYARPYLSRSGFLIVPVVAKIDPEHHIQLNREEVEDCFEVPWSFLMDAANHQRQSRFWQGEERHFYVMPHEGRLIWGVSAGIIRAIWEQAQP